nr:PREDICTED: regulator of microtubule dynamics protein 3 isoform X2 [Equus przewalskii]
MVVRRRIRVRCSMSSLGALGGARAGLGLLLGTAAGLGFLCALYSRRWKWNQRHGQTQTQSLPNSLDYTPTSEPGRQVRPLRAVPGEAGDAAVLPGLPREGQEEVLDRLDFVLTSLVALRREVEELRSSLQGLAGQIVGEVRSHVEETQRVSRRRRFPFARERSDSTGSSSVYFTATSGTTFTDAESEGGYTTANAESDYERESDRESDDGEDEVSCETVKMGRKDSLDLEMASGLDTGALEAGGSPGLEDVLPLLQQADELHQGSEQGRREGFQLLLNNKLAYGSRQDFLWRLARAYSDMCELTEEASEKKSYALNGKEEAEAALEKGAENAECHLWYAVLCGQLAEHEGIQRRVQSGFSFKEHVDKAIALQPENPLAHFLLGRWCYQVSHLGWLEKKTATALFESTLSATVQDALQSFLKAEELQPGFSKAGRVYISKCYRELGKNSEARQWMKLALELPDVTNEDSAFQKDLEELEVILGE